MSKTKLSPFVHQLAMLQPWHDKVSQSVQQLTVWNFPSQEKPRTLPYWVMRCKTVKQNHMTLAHLMSSMYRRVSISQRRFLPDSQSHSLSSWWQKGLIIKLEKLTNTLCSSNLHHQLLDSSVVAWSGQMNRTWASKCNIILKDMFQLNNDTIVINEDVLNELLLANDKGDK